MQAPMGLQFVLHVLQEAMLQLTMLVIHVMLGHTRGYILLSALHVRLESRPYQGLAVVPFVVTGRIKLQLCSPLALIVLQARTLVQTVACLHAPCALLELMPQACLPPVKIAVQGHMALEVEAPRVLPVIPRTTFTAELRHQHVPSVPMA